MNAGIYRLVYNEFRSIWMVVSEMAKSHQPSSGTKRVRRSRHFLLLALIVVASDAWADSAINTIAINAIPNVQKTLGPNTVINPLVVNPANSAGYLLSIQQADKKAILSGPSFDIGRASVVNFNHTGGAGSATLIRISDGPKTTIEGTLNSPNGQIYLINQNGILFGNGARVDVNGLVASTLNMRDSDFMNDLGQLYAYTDKKRAAYVWNTDNYGVANVNGLSFSDSLVQIEPDARIKAALGSSVMLFGTGVINKGSIETSEGQVVLAAGGKVYLSFAPDLNFDPANPKDSVPPATYAKDSPYRALAGVLVEVDPQAKDVAVLPQDLLGVTNDVSGRILAQRGNITMAALMVNQSGRVVATTSVSQKGSIRLLARDTKVETAAVGFTASGTTTSNGNTVITGSRTGELTFGDNSQTLILPEHAAGVALANQHLGVNQIGVPAPQVNEKSFVDTVLAALSPTGKTVTDEQIFNAPTLEAVGNTVIVNDGANIVASGGFINLSSMIASSTSRLTELTRLYIGKNTLIDASGLKDVAVSMDRNFVEVLLTSNDLQDDPLNKAGFLYHKNVWFDIRHLPDTRVSSLAGYLKQVPRDIGEKLATAGSVTLSSEGDIVQRVGSVVDVSGGSLNYTAGTHKETWLQDANGNAYALSTAPAGVSFTGFLNNSNYRTYQEHAYSEGVMAGLVNINALAINLDGQFKGGAAYGEYQRNSANLGGMLTLIINKDNPENIEFLNKNNTASLADSFVSDTLLNSSPAMIDVGMLSNSGFENLSFSTAGNVTTHAALNLALASKLTLIGQKIEINDDIISRGGSITLTSTSANIAVNPSVKLDVSGLWTNDFVNPALATGRIVNKGGSVKISAQGAVSLGQGSVVDVSGGGSLNSAGKVTNGDAGSIAIEANRVKDSSGIFTGTTSDVKPILAGELRGYALGVGGNLSITAPFVTIGATGTGDDRELLLNPLFFQNGGFTSYNLIGRDGVLVKGDAQVDVHAQNYQLTSNYRLAETGAHVADFAKPTLLADFLRSSTSLTLASQQASPLVSTAPFNIPGIAFGRGSVMVQTGATLQVDSRGSKTLPSIALSGWDNQVYVDGTLKADGGTIALTMNGDPVNDVNDSDFNASQAIWLGSNAKLQVAGYSQLTPNSTGLRAGTVYDGGTISLNAKKGYIVAKSGSLLDVSGVSATLDILNTPTNIASNGGTINLTAREGMLLDASFNAEAPGALSGNLNIVIGRGTSNNLYRVNHQTPSTYPGYNYINYDNEYPNQQWVIDVVQSKANVGAGFSAGLVSGDSIQASAGGLAKVNADSINHGGFARATLKAADVIRFEDNVTLNLPSSLRLDAPKIEALGSSIVNLNAPTVMLSNALISDADVATRISSNYSAPAPSTGTTTLNINSQLLDLRGQFSLSGFSQSNLISTNDIRLTGFNSSNNAPVGELRTTGTLNMTARQIYPTSLSDYTLSVEGVGGRAVFNRTGTHDSVLSAGGKLTVNAENINQNGVLLAPFGTIALNASQNLTLENGSLTSVAANGALIPFGYTNRDGLDYLYNFGSGISSIVAPPERVVKLNASNVTASAGSTVDISSGGDLYAYEWVPGVGGSTDVLANGAKQSAFSTLGSNASNTWAIMPANKSAYGSYDTQYWNGTNVQAGDAVYLSGMPGLAAGYYTLLPARYALLPGAMLVSAVSGHQDIRAGNVLAQNDGSSLVSGHLAAYTSDGYVSTSRTAGFLVRAGSDSHKLAEYSDTFSSQRYAGVTDVMQTVDAGRYSVAATSSMVLDGVLKALHAQTGKGAEVDVAAPKLLVVNHGEQTGLVEVDGNNYLAVDEKTLTNMNASSLLLGGTRSNGLVEVVSSEVRMGANASLSGPEVILAATNKVILKNTATVTGTGSGGSKRDLTIGRVAVAEVVDPTTEVVTTPAAIAIDGNGALLRVSGEKAVNLTRINADRSHGDLQIENGATVQGDGTVQLDATHGMTVAGTLGFGAGGALTVAAGRVSLGSPDNNAQVTDGLWLTQEQLAPLQQASSLVLKSYSTIDLYGAVNVGNDKLDLTMQSAGVAGYQNTNRTAKITARTLTLNNADKVDFTDTPVLSDLTMPVSGTNGTLEVSAQTIVSAANTVRLAGFDQVNLSASKEIVAQGVGSLNADNALTLSAGRVTALSAADHTIAATDGLLKVQGYRLNDLGVAPTDASKLLAPAQSAKLNLQGTSVILAEYANIVAQGAKVTVQAIGQNATDSVTMQSGSSIMAKGSATTIKDQTIVLPAGKVALISDHGNVELQSGSVVDVSLATGGNAGTVNITAVNGNATLAGTIVGGANAVANVDAMAIVDENGQSGINQALTALQGFAGSQSYRMRTGDAVITTDVSTKNLVLTADAGFITVASKIDASGEKGGSIELYARDNLTVNNGAQLIAKGTADKLTTAGTIGNGGTVILSSDSGIVSASSNALIDVTGDQVGAIHGAGGKVILRAARTTAADNSAFNPVVTTGNGSIYVVNISDFNLTAGTVVAFKANTNSRALAKLNVNSTGIKSLMKNGGTTVALNELKSGNTYIAVYDGTNFQLVSSTNLANGSDIVGSGVNVSTSTTGVITGASQVSIEAVKVYNLISDSEGISKIDTKYQNLVTADTNAFASRTAGISSLFSPTQNNVVALVTPGVEIRSDGDLNLANDWLIGTSSYISPATGSPVAKMPAGGILTLRATGSLNIMGNLAYEQFALNGNNVSALPGTWSYRLVGGADSSSTNPEAVKATATPLIPSIYIADGKYIRTGSGFIDAVAGGDIILGQNSAIYTEGTPDTAAKIGFSTLIQNYQTYKELYPLNGGDVSLSSLASITGAASTSQTGNAWLYRAAKTTAGLINPNVRWWSRYDKFVNGVAALGGGDVTVTAGADINNLQFDSASNGRMGGSTNIAAINSDLTVNGGGDVDIKAEGNITNALMAVGKGVAVVQSGKSASVKFELMDASAKAYADGDLNIMQVSNPTVTTPGSGADNTPLKIFVYSYAKDSAVSAVSAVGDVTLAGTSVYPGIVYAAAPNGNVTANGLTLYPSALGNASLLAGNNLNVSDFVMSDVDPSILPQILTKPAYNSLQSAPLLNAYSGSVAHSSGLLHANDLNSEPVRLYAGNDVLFSTYDATTKITTINSAVILPKAVEVYAGRDVVDANLIVQNNKSIDVSVIEAGGNIRYSDAGIQDGAIMPNAASLQVAGPGRLQLIAGQDIDLGSSGGIRSVGDLYNPYLTPHGADIMVMPGSGNGLNYTGMIDAYLESNPTMAAIYLPQLVEYMKARQGLSNLSASEALVSFKLQDRSQQSQFMNSVFYAELRAGGRDAIDTKNASFGDYTRSERAILTMFPKFTTNSALVNQTSSLMSAFKNISTEAISNPGDLKLFYSQIRSEGGGDIELLVPGGYINSGLAVAGTLNKPGTDLGIVSIRGGVIDAFVRNNFQVNQSRVFTLGGSDLMLYSALTNIDAGRGAKTSAATPPPVLRIRNGQITYDYSAAVSGSGIAALTSTGGNPGTVDLFAPYGEINAGEAGIRSAGNINLGAVRVIGADNIKAGGVTTGAPVASVAGVSVTAPASSNSSSQGKQGDQVGDAAKQASNNKLNAIPSLISVEILSVGDDSSVPAKSCSDRKECQI